MAQDFKAMMGLTATVWVDPKRVTYAHLGMVRSWGSIVDRRAAKNGVRAFQKGFRQGMTQGDPQQQGGVLVVNVRGEAEFEYLSEVAGDMPETAAVLDRAYAAARAT